MITFEDQLNELLECHGIELAKKEILVTEIIKISKNLENTDNKLIDWIESMMTKDNDYCEIYFAGLKAERQHYFKLKVIPKNSKQ